MINFFLKILAFFISLIPHWTVVVDTETTGLYNAELLQVSLVSGTGRVLFNKYVKPDNDSEWPDAQKINHISPRMVKHRLHFSSYAPVVNAYLKHTKRLIGYNVEKFDLPLLNQYGVNTSADIVDIMLDDNEKISKPGQRRESWRKLVVVARRYGYFFSGHDALEDCLATLHINVIMHPSIQTILYFVRKLLRVIVGALIIWTSRSWLNSFGSDLDAISQSLPYLAIMCWSYFYGPITGVISALIASFFLSPEISIIIASVFAFLLGLSFKYIIKPPKHWLLRLIALGLFAVLIGVAVFEAVPLLLDVEPMNDGQISNTISMMICGIHLCLLFDPIIRRIL